MLEMPPPPSLLPATLFPVTVQSVSVSAGTSRCMMPPPGPPLRRFPTCVQSGQGQRGAVGENDPPPDPAKRRYWRWCSRGVVKDPVVVHVVTRFRFRYVLPWITQWVAVTVPKRVRRGRCSPKF